MIPGCRGHFIWDTWLRYARLAPPTGDFIVLRSLDRSGSTWGVPSSVVSAFFANRLVRALPSREIETIEKEIEQCSRWLNLIEGIGDPFPAIK